jgi:uncharacterized protein
MSVDIIVIGLGPAGLAFLNQYSGKETVLAIDSGPVLLERNRFDDVSSINGVGGAGLYSDGKISLFPSATELWKMNGSDIALNTLVDLFKKFNVDIPPFEPIDDSNVKGDNVKLKQYPSFYIDLDTRIKIIEYLYYRAVEKSNIKILTESVVKNLMPIGQNYMVTVYNKNTNRRSDIMCKKIVFAGGRFYPLMLHNTPLTFRRMEFGTRIYGDSESPIFNKIKLLDPKLIITHEDKQFRTFCWCRKGEMILTNYDNNDNSILTWSGRADCDDTSQSNFGFNIRLDETYLKYHCQMYCDPFDMSFDQLEKYGEKNKLIGMYTEGVKKLATVLGEEVLQMRFKGPCIEGIGYYPNLEPNSMKVINNNIWAIGDNSGVFRGIAAAMLSGFMVAKQM